MRLVAPELSIEGLDHSIWIFVTDPDPMVSRVRLWISGSTGRALRIAVRGADLMLQDGGPGGSFQVDDPLTLRSLAVESAPQPDVGTPLEVVARSGATLIVGFEPVRLVPGRGALAIWVRALVDEREQIIVVPVKVLYWPESDLASDRE